MARRYIPYPPRVWTKTVPRENGFTLLEVIVSLALFGLIALAAFAFLGQSLSLWERSGDWGEDERNIRLVERTLERFVGHLYTGPLPHGEEQGFIGDGHSISAIREGEDGLLKTGILYDGSSQSLVYWEENKGDRSETPLLEGVDRWELDYLDSKNAWQSDWVTQVPLPRCIRVRWTLHGRVQPMLMLPIYGGRLFPPP